MTSPIGLIGLGNMGAPMARTLARKSFAVLASDLDAARRAAVDGVAKTTAAAAEVFAGCDIVLLSLPSSREVEAVALGPAGFAERARPGALLIDASTADPPSTQRIAEALAARGLHMLDAPVSGGPAGAAEGQLTFMVGGTAEALARGRPVLEALARRIVHVGGSGAGNVAKLANNLLCAAHLLTTAEAVKLARAAGVAPERLLDAVNAASGRSGVSEVHFPRWILSGGFDSGFTMGLMRKDVRLALALAERLGLTLDLAARTGALWREGSAALADGEDFTRIAAWVMGEDRDSGTS